MVMAFPGVITPREYSRHRLMFERGYRVDDETIVRRASIGDRFDVVRHQLSLIAMDKAGGPGAAVEAYQSQLGEPLSSYVHEQVAALQRPSITSHSSYRLNPQLYASLVDHLALLPVLADFPDEEARSHRRKLISGQGMFGIIAEVLQTELSNAPHEDIIALRHWSGFIHEMSPLALSVRKHNPNRFALPSLPAEDEYQKTDLIYYICNKDGVARRLPRQVKADELAADVSAQDLPKLIGGRALGNHWDNPHWSRDIGYSRYQTAYAIADEISGVASDHQIDTLDYISNSLVTAIEKRRPFIVSSFKQAA